MFGSFDVILLIDAKDPHEFGDMMYQVIEKTPNIVHTETCVILPSGE